MAGDLNSDPSTLNGKKLLNLANMYNLELHVTEPTHFGQNANTILDQFVSNCSQFIEKLEISDPVSTNDNHLHECQLVF